MPNLCHKTGVIKDQLESGMYLLKRVGFYLRKIATSKKNCSVELNKFSDHELEKKERISRDRMHLHVNAYQQMQHVMTQMAFFDLKFGSDLLDRVAEPLLNWHKDAELRLKKLMQQEDKLEGAIAALRAKIKSERVLCMKAWTDLCKDYKVRGHTTEQTRPQRTPPQTQTAPAATSDDEHGDFVTDPDDDKSHSRKT